MSIEMPTPSWLVKALSAQQNLEKAEARIRILEARVGKLREAFKIAAGEHPEMTTEHRYSFAMRIMQEALAHDDGQAEGEK